MLIIRDELISECLLFTVCTTTPPFGMLKQEYEVNGARAHVQGPYYIQY